MKTFILGLVVLASSSMCDGDKRDKVTRIEQPGQFSAGLCGGRIDEWLITVQRKDGTSGAMCVKPEVGRKQTVGHYFIP